MKIIFVLGNLLLVDVTAFTNVMYKKEFIHPLFKEKK